MTAEFSHELSKLTNRDFINEGHS